MNKFELLRSEAEVQFGKDPNGSAIASRALDFLQEWSEKSSCNGKGLSILEKRKRKKECAEYITAGLYRAREEEHGFLGALLTAIAFQLLVQLIVRWIMKKFFE